MGAVHCRFLSDGNISLDFLGIASPFGFLVRFLRDASGARREGVKARER